MTVPMTKVESSHLSEHGYDPATKELHLKFKGPHTFVYAGVEPEQYQALQDAPSKGQHFHREIKGKFTHRRLEAEG